MSDIHIPVENPTHALLWRGKSPTMHLFWQRPCAATENAINSIAHHPIDKRRSGRVQKAVVLLAAAVTFDNVLDLLHFHS